MKKLTIILFVLVLCTTLVVGCSTASPTPTKPALTSATVTTQAATTSPTVSNLPVTTTPAATKPATTTVPATTNPADNKYGGTLRFILPSGPSTPIGWPREATTAALNSMLMGVALPVEEDSKGNLNPRLAGSYKVDTNPDNPSITFVLRKGLKFQDGTEVNARAVQWNFQQEMLPGSTNIGNTTFWKSIDVVDDYTVRINLKSWRNTIPRSFSGPTGAVVSPTAYEKNGIDWMRWNIVGAGPFKQTGFSRDVGTRFVKYDDYFDPGKPYLQGLQLLFVTDELTQLALLKSGGGDILQISPIRASELLSQGYNIITSGGGRNLNLIPDSMNSTSVWANPKVRQAAEYAIDKESIAKTLGYGYWDAAYQIASKNSAAYNPALAPRKYDPAKAKQLLADAGYPNGFKSTIIFQTSDNKDVLLAIQSQLKAVGINVELQIVDAAKFATYQVGTWSNALLWGFSFSFPNYNYGLNLYFGPTTAWYQSMKKPADWQKLFDASLTSPTPVPELMQKCVQAFYDEVTLIPIYTEPSIWATSDKVHDAGLGELGDFTQWTPYKAWLSK